MRLFPKRRARLPAAVDRLPVGPWLVSERFDDALTRADRLALAVHLAALRLNPHSAVSGDQRSVLRVESGAPDSSPRVELGKVSFERFAADWAVDIVDDGDPAGIALVHDTPSYDEARVANSAVRDGLRDHLAAVLEGDAPLSRLPGLPDARSLPRAVVLSVGPFARARSPFSSDYLLPPPADFVPGGLVVFPGVPLERLNMLIDQLDLPVVRTDDFGIELVDLSGGRRDEVGLRVISSPEGCGLQLEFVEESLSAVGLHRAYRSAIAVLDGLRRLDGRGDVARPAAAVLEDWTKVQRADIDLDAMTPIWTVRRSVDIVMLPLAGDLPVGAVVTCRDVDLVDTLVEASRWLTVRQRASGNDPVGQNARSAPRRFFTRRPVVASRGRRTSSPVLRYGYASSNDLATTPSVDSPDWFWGVTSRSTTLDDGRRRTVLMIDGLSSSHGVLAYATELFALFDAFGALVRHRFPEAEVETIYLTDDAHR